MTRPARASALAALSSLLTGAAPEAPPPTSGSRVVEDQGFRIKLDMARQVIAVDVPEDRGLGEGEPAEAPISPTLADPRGGMVSASVLAQKAKQFDDGLYAAVELAAQAGAGSFGGKGPMLRALAARATPGASPGEGNAVAVLLAACRQGRIAAPVPPGLAGLVEETEKAFREDPIRSKPLGFYTWSPGLADVFRQDRMLQAELVGAGGIARLADALAADPGSKATYESYLALTDRLTNPGAELADLRKVMARPAGSAAPARKVAAFPASRSHEGDLVMKLFAGRPIPEGFSLVDELARRIRSGRVDLAPTPRSGWYDYQTYALEPLVAPERMPEAPRLRLGEAYRKQLLELFRGVLALTRETHVKQLEIPAPGSMMAPIGRPRVTITIRPDLPAEPLVTYYRRRADSYEFVRKALLEAFGPAGLEAMRRQTATGPVAASLAEELEATRALFSGAAEATARRLGIPADPKLDADEAAFRAWSTRALDDPDVGRDARMMVPVFYDRGRRKTKVWVFLGWSSRRALVHFATPPGFEVARDGRKVEGDEAPEVKFGPEYQPLAYPVSAEVYVDTPLDRDEFRKLCDTWKTRRAILAHLR